MRRYLLTAALLCSVTPVMAQPPASPPQPSEQACLRQANMYSFKVVPGNRSLIVTTIDNRRYRVNIMGQCNNLQYNMALHFKTKGTSNLSCVSKGDSVLYRDPAGPGICIVHDVQYQTSALDQQDAANVAAEKQK